MSAPVAPGRLSEPIDPQAALSYLDALGRWKDDRRRELDQLDQAALSAPEGPAVTGDVMLSLALWKAVADRYDLLLATWDSGRVGEVERMRMSSLIWGRLDATVDPSVLARSARSHAGSLGAPAVRGQGVTGLTVSLPEATRLSDALAAQLRVRLALDPSGLAVTERIRELRAQLERIRDQVDLEPPGNNRDRATTTQAALARRLAAAADKASRGGDVGGLLGPLEIEATLFERDLIVRAAQRREARGKVQEARELKADLEAREGALRQLVQQCVQAVDPAPRYAVPDVSALGPVPNTVAALEVYLTKLGQVSQALTMAQDAYSAALHDKEQLAGRLQALGAKAAALGLDQNHAVRTIFTLAREELSRSPSHARLATELVALYQTYLSVLGSVGAQASASRPDPAPQPQLGQKQLRKSR